MHRGSSGLAGTELCKQGKTGEELARNEQHNVLLNTEFGEGLCRAQEHL